MFRVAVNFFVASSNHSSARFYGSSRARRDVECIQVLCIPLLSSTQLVCCCNSYHSPLACYSYAINTFIPPFVKECNIVLVYHMAVR